MSKRLVRVAAGALLFLLPAIPSRAQCVASQGTVTVTLEEADSGVFRYTWRIRNDDGGIGNRLENAFFEIGTATPSSPSTSGATWLTSQQNLTTFQGRADWTAYNFTYSDGTLIYDGAEETFSYSLDQFVDNIRVRTIQKNGQTEDFADFTSAGSCSILPVELVSFDARVDGPSVALQWSTATEVGAAGFEIQYRGVGEYETVGFVEAAGSSDELRLYRFDHLLSGPVFGSYRLKMIDLDGTFAYSPDVTVAGNLPEGFFISRNYPNPFNPTTQFEIAVEQAQHVQVDVYDVTGRRVATLLNGQLEAATIQTVVFSAETLPSGLYIVRSMGETFSSSRVVTLLK